MLAELGWLARLELPRLSRRKGRALMASLLGRDPGPDLAERVFRRSEGNPLFLETLLRSDRGAGEELPESLRDLVLADVERLSAQAQDVLEALAVAGQWCGHGLLAAATGSATGSCRAPCGRRCRRTRWSPKGTGTRSRTP